MLNEQHRHKLEDLSKSLGLQEYFKTSEASLLDELQNKGSDISISIKTELTKLVRDGKLHFTDNETPFYRYISPLLFESIWCA